MSGPAYSPFRRALHWLGALVLLLAWLSGLIGHEQEGAAWLWGMRVHALLGLSGVAIGVLWLLAVWRLPDPPPLEMPRWRQLAFAWNHRLAFVAVPGLRASGLALGFGAGVFAFLFGGAETLDLSEAAPAEGHEVFAFALAGLVAMHVVGVAAYQKLKGDTLGRMGVGPGARK